MNSITCAIAPGGIFVGQFFGPEDSWSNHADMNFETEKEVRYFLKNFQILKLSEEKQSRETVLGESHFWHVFHVIAKKN